MLAMNAEDIGNIVQRRRTRAGLSQAELATRIGVSRKWIADLEGGHPRAQLQLVLDVLSALDAVVEVTDVREASASVSGVARDAQVGRMHGGEGTSPRNLRESVKATLLAAAAASGPPLGIGPGNPGGRATEGDSHHD